MRAAASRAGDAFLVDDVWGHKRHVKDGTEGVRVDKMSVQDKCQGSRATGSRPTRDGGAAHVALLLIRSHVLECQSVQQRQAEHASLLVLDLQDGLYLQTLQMQD